MLAGMAPRRRGKAARTKPRVEWGPEALALVARVLEGVERRYGVTGCRGGRVGVQVRARREWIRLVRDSWGLSLHEAAGLCGVDHTTVMLACREVSR